MGRVASVPSTAMAVVAFVVVILLVGGCASGDGDDPATAASPPRLAPLTPTDPDRISEAQRNAIVALGEAASEDAPNQDGHHHGHAEAAPATVVALDPDQQAVFDDEWETAVAAVPDFDTAAERTAAGYVRAAVQVRGIGVHWVDWTQVDAPLDPARPSMLLVDERNGRDDLVGFSYWVHSAEEPEGFTGPNDVWHRHANLCIVNGWVDREAAEPGQCVGVLLPGADLWMLHAWVVPDRANRWGEFAVHHPALCPPAVGTPDILRCPQI